MITPCGIQMPYNSYSFILKHDSKYTVGLGTWQVGHSNKFAAAASAPHT